MFPILNGGIWQRPGLCQTFLCFSAQTFTMFSSGAANKCITKPYFIELLQHNQVVFRGTDKRGIAYLCNEYSEHDGLEKLCDIVKKATKKVILHTVSINHCCSVELNVLSSVTNCCSFSIHSAISLNYVWCVRV